MPYAITDDCIICGTCWEICPTHSIVPYKWYYKVAKTCVECGACIRVCPNASIRRVKRRRGVPSRIPKPPRPADFELD